MPKYDAEAVRALIARRRPGHALEGAFYTDPEIFRADIDAIFHQHWIYVAVECEVPEPGDALAVDIGASSVVIVRGDDEQVRAFHNVCRHRGARLLPPGPSIVGNLVCPYHAWTYGLDGDLKFAEHMGDGFDPSCHGLRPVAMRSVGGLLFICLAETPPDDIDDLARQIEPYLAPHDLRNTRVAHSADLVEYGNWKLVMENNRECYHCTPNHPELTIPLFAYGFGFAPEELTPEGQEQAARYETLRQTSHAAWEEAGLPSRLIEHLDDRPTGFRTERLPLDGAGESQTMDTMAACRVPLGSISDKAAGGLHFWTQPNSWHHFMSDHVVTFTALPLDEGRTLVRTKWLVHKDAVEGVDYDLEKLTDIWNVTNRQDADLVEMTQRGVADPAYVPGPYSPYTEGLVEKFMLWYLARLRAHLG
ncbi:aromatic ring-hydroxylating oxygenase subunit alpha [Gluconacetobacter tumulicola]|uniref:Aromatic ring-hydroxylating dioxygenase subunit alpha n=1 Tax=Gluconacetobacter tumulicola TaxID=1017177 RepID=A0A7W4JAV6_9PROT|nr:aromatic ring-hydroxylating dioxygenase subunit alpha [Gluconacetobacter tumulicola]MBB2177905.1 aromatic ring-hydroxylating dioxygenase subunit alpha [Gluconacetobacter tumulicola]